MSSEPRCVRPHPGSECEWHRQCPKHPRHQLRPTPGALGAICSTLAHVLPTCPSRERKHAILDAAMHWQRRCPTCPHKLRHRSAAADPLAKDPAHCEQTPAAVLERLASCHHGRVPKRGRSLASLCRTQQNLRQKIHPEHPGAIPADAPSDFCRPPSWRQHVCQHCSDFSLQPCETANACALTSVSGRASKLQPPCLRSALSCLALRIQHDAGAAVPPPLQQHGEAEQCNRVGYLRHDLPRLVRRTPVQVASWQSPAP
mmetsp:Transcript_57993/g.166290  ORF Transcript_57993/g.166290 Transcript_57993/m.166290 type:complete len:258 (+) Transcript_57993:1453-2226(+)